MMACQFPEKHIQTHKLEPKSPNPKERDYPVRLSIRLFAMLLATLVALVLPITISASYAGHPDAAANQPLKTEGVMDAKTAFEKAKNGEIVLLDIRSPEEWKETGTGTYAERVSMHQEGFLLKLDALIDNDKSRAIALICAVGGRSNFIQEELTKRGYTNVIDVAEGMLGSRYGEGWLKRGLPITK